jgi:hypothetical protein
MSLKQSIVVKNEFSLRTANGGTRGGTPGYYVLGYMSRKGATETLSPNRLNDQAGWIRDYMAREDATEQAMSVEDLKGRFREFEKLGGRAFGYGDVSMSDAKLREASADIQKNFDAGKTVLKTVISFDEAYLREQGIIAPDFHCENRGDYRGNIDQLKLRMAIMNGMQKVARDYDDLQYVGVIQVDTKHVHCHLAMVDRGVGNLMKDGTQRGKITDKGKRNLRRGIDMFLDEKQTVKMMTSNVQYDKQNTVGYIKRYTHKTMNNRGFAQFMIACLPEDRTLWRAGSNSQEMAKANSIVREYVTQLLEQPDSGFEESKREIREYADYRMSREGLTNADYKHLIESKEEEIIQQSMNAVYSILKQIPEEDCGVNTPLLDAMSMEYDDVLQAVSETTDAPDAMMEFSYKLRTYKMRLDQHAKGFQEFHEARVDYERKLNLPDGDPNRPTEDSKALYEFYQLEEEYNKMLMTKYRYFLDFIPPDEDYQKELEELKQDSEYITALDNMLSDSDIRRMTPARAEEYGLRAYDITGGQYTVTDRQRLVDDLMRRKADYEVRRDAYETKLIGYGLVLNEDDALERRKAYEFDDVKALDIHHMSYDFSYDFEIPIPQSQAFIAMADRRYEAFQAAKEYLITSHQTERLASLPEHDVMQQHEFADMFRQTAVELHTARGMDEQEQLRHKQANTIRLDYGFYVRQEDEIKEVVKTVIENTVQSLQYE